MRAYHYEWVAYTDNLCYGRMLLARDRSKSWVKQVAETSYCGAYIIIKKRFYEN